MRFALAFALLGTVLCVACLRWLRRVERHAEHRAEVERMGVRLRELQK